MQEEAYLLDILPSDVGLLVYGQSRDLLPLSTVTKAGFVGIDLEMLLILDNTSQGLAELGHGYLEHGDGPFRKYHPALVPCDAQAPFPPNID